MKHRKGCISRSTRRPGRGLSCGFSGPDEELDKLRDAVAAFQPTYFTLQYGIRR